MLSDSASSHPAISRRWLAARLPQPAGDGNPPCLLTGDKQGVKLETQITRHTTSH